ncbi:hypothetical protein BDV97DRAFT_373988 [Delphinella strobiligena]|nr:hypothetical protein BDV97DRAFT_373988 [Delphinella strobiligena]
MSKSVERIMCNQAGACNLKSKGPPSKIDRADLPTPDPDEIVFKNHAVAICPADNLVQSLGMFIERFPTDQEPILLVVLGGSNTVGISSIQVAVDSGVKVVSTASPHNHTLVQQFGASKVFDYNSSSAIEDIVATSKASRKQFAGVVDCISTLNGSKTIAVVHPSPVNAPKDIEFAEIFALSIAYQFPWVAEHVWGGWVPAALAADGLKALPQDLVIGKGLDSAQVGMDRLKEGLDHGGDHGGSTMGDTTMGDVTMGPMLTDEKKVVVESDYHTN